MSDDVKDKVKDAGKAVGEAASKVGEKVKDAVLAKEPEATIDRVEQDPQGYHAHITK